MSYSKMKRAFDIFFSLMFLIILFPLFFILICAIKLESSGPFIFKQKRVGINKKQFYILKFRTMKVNAPKDIPTHLLVDSKLWITKVGSFLRKTSLDELPQLINILRGEMSFVGPRPALWNQDDLINERDKFGANDIRPGLTGWAQINGRDELPIEQKAKLDGEYVQKLGIMIDLRCLLLTIMAVLKRDGFVEGGTERFDSIGKRIPNKEAGVSSNIEYTQEKIVK